MIWMSVVMSSWGPFECRYGGCHKSKPSFIHGFKSSSDFLWATISYGPLQSFEGSEVGAPVVREVYNGDRADF